MPTNTYPCADGKYVVIGGNGDSIYQRLMVAAGRADLAEDPRLASNPGRVTHQGEIDSAIEAWTRTLPMAEVLSALEGANVPGGPIYSVEDMATDPQYAARGMFEEIEANGRPLKVPALCPVMQHGRGRTDWAGPELGEHTREVLEGLLSMPPERVDALIAAGAVAQHYAK